MEYEGLKNYFDKFSNNVYVEEAFINALKAFLNEYSVTFKVEKSGHNDLPEIGTFFTISLGQKRGLVIKLRLDSESKFMSFLVISKDRYASFVLESLREEMANCLYEEIDWHQEFKSRMRVKSAKYRIPGAVVKTIENVSHQWSDWFYVVAKAVLLIEESLSSKEDEYLKFLEKMRQKRSKPIPVELPLSRKKKLGSRIETEVFDVEIPPLKTILEDLGYANYHLLLKHYPEKTRRYLSQEIKGYRHDPGSYKSKEVVSTLQTYLKSLQVSPIHPTKMVLKDIAANHKYEKSLVLELPDIVEVYWTSLGKGWLLRDRAKAEIEYLNVPRVHFSISAAEHYSLARQIVLKNQLKSYLRMYDVPPDIVRFPLLVCFMYYPNIFNHVEKVSLKKEIVRMTVGVVSEMMTSLDSYEDLLFSESLWLEFASYLERNTEIKSLDINLDPKGNSLLEPNINDVDRLAEKKRGVPRYKEDGGHEWARIFHDLYRVSQSGEFSVSVDSLKVTKVNSRMVKADFRFSRNINVSFGYNSETSLCYLEVVIGRDLSGKFLNNRDLFSKSINGQHEWVGFKKRKKKKSKKKTDKEAIIKIFPQRVMTQHGKIEIQIGKTEMEKVRLMLTVLDQLKKFVQNNNIES